MDPLFLTFRNDALERGYRSHLLRGASNYKRSAVGMLLFLRTVVIVVTQPTGDVKAALCSAAPLAELLFRNNISEPVLEKFAPLIQLAFGFAHSFLALGGAASAVMMYPDSTKIALVVGFTTTQLFTMCWYRLRLAHQVLLNTVTVILGLTMYLDPICTSVDAMGWSPLMADCVCRVDRFLGGVMLGTGGIDSKQCRDLGVLACRQLYLFVHIFLGVFVFSCWLWRNEKKHRIHYVKHHQHQNQDQQIIAEIINSTDGCGVGFLECVYALILLWQGLMVLTLMESRP
ncbi:hypothetical protein BSKO_11327 [Bryopsis sp. KO-2023]|nr:hypothetical protein BSKO_11327 [Bryopsis sp. KO-2023]